MKFLLLLKPFKALLSYKFIIKKIVLMKQLSNNWITEGLIDFEYKKYILLDYLQEVSKNFDEKKLYPSLSDLINHYRNLDELKKNKTIVSESFPQHISKLDFDNFRLQFEKILFDDTCMEEIESILNFSIPAIEQQMEEGKELYSDVEHELKIFPVGIIPLHPEEGYMMLIQSGKKQTKVYEYTITLFENTTESFRGIRTQYIGSWKQSITNTFENIKGELLKSKKEIPNPGTFVVESTQRFPLNETLLPVAKRSLVRYIYNQAA